jgi:glycosyltransferase involved in cell wall biosynthesis
MFSPAAEHHERQDFVLSAGRVWDEGKNFRVLNECAIRVNAPMLVAGAAASPNGTRVDLPHLRLLGPIGESTLQALYGQASIFVSASRYEPFGLAVLEAALAGAPLVLSDIPTFHELWSDAATFCAAEDPEAFASAIRRLLNDPAERARMGRAAQIRAQRYTSAAMTDRVLDLYCSVLPHASGRAA